jgi:hypothetical protein
MGASPAPPDAPTQPPTPKAGHSRARWITSLSVVLASTAITFTLATGVVSLLSPSSNGVSARRANEQGFDLQLDFGLSRAPITRTIQADLCSRKNSPYPECSEERSSAASTALARPQILSATLGGDLQKEGGGNQFPVNQLSITATNIGKSGFQIAVQANPLSPYTVPDGAYTGYVAVDRAAGPKIYLKILVDLGNRTGTPTALALMALVGGALLGGFAKWLNDVVGPLTSVRRRLRGVARRLQRYATVLPEDVQLQIADVLTCIRDGDPKEANDALDPP